MRLKDKIVLITGAAGAVGAAMVEAASAAGAIPITSDLAGLHGAAHALDVTSEPDWLRVIGAIDHEHGRLDGLVNAAGLAALATIEDTDYALWRQIMAVNLDGTFLGCKHALPIMVKQGGGRVVNLIGNDGVKPSYWEICPGAANAAGQNLTMSLAGQYGKHGVSFCAVNPGPVRTERWVGLVNAMSRDMKLSYEEADQLAPSSIPMGRIAEVEEVANLVVMLASPLMHMVNGTMIEIDGGQEKSLMDRLRDKK